jgi:hypothetical protein
MIFLPDVSFIADCVKEERIKSTALCIRIMKSLGKN